MIVHPSVQVVEQRCPTVAMFPNHVPIRAEFATITPIQISETQQGLLARASRCAATGGDGGSARRILPSGDNRMTLTKEQQLGSYRLMWLIRRSSDVLMDFSRFYPLANQFY